MVATYFSQLKTSDAALMLSDVPVSPVDPTHDPEGIAFGALTPHRRALAIYVVNPAIHSAAQDLSLWGLFRDEWYFIDILVGVDLAVDYQALALPDFVVAFDRLFLQSTDSDSKYKYFVMFDKPQTVE
jgi:hypothetical protein